MVNEVASRPRVPLVVALLTAAIVLTYVAYFFAPPMLRDQIDYTFALIPERFDPQSRFHFTAWYEPLAQIFGHGFVHAAWWHAGLNAFFLYGAGRIPARRLGWARFLGVYLLSSAFGALLFVALNWGEAALAIGASDAVCGVFMAYFLSVRSDWRQSLAIPEVRNQLLVLIGLNVVLMGALSEFNVFPIAWEGHLGGFIGGALGYVLLQPKSRPEPWTR